MKYKDKNLPVAERVENLLSLMTIDEKIAQTIAIDPKVLTLSEEERQAVLNKGELIRDDLKDRLAFGVGAVQLPGKELEPVEGAIYRNTLQRYVLEHTRLQIPILSHEECLNGHLAKSSTMFPKPIGLASTFNTELIREVYSAIGKETRARGGHQAFTPVLDLGRDARWGRIEETYGEDTYLVTRMGAAAVEGLQGGKNGVEEHHVVSSPKHFAGYAQVAGGRNFAPTVITERMLHNEILPPFKEAVMKSHVEGIMPSHSEIDGVPCHGSYKLLTDILRKQWGFKGIVVSDYNDVERLNILHHLANNRTEAAMMGLRAGVDMDLPMGSAFRYLKEAIQQEPELIKELDEAVRRILRIKFKLGLFENPFVDTKQIDTIIHCEAHKKLARKTAEETVILLKNDNKLLPLNKNEINKIAVVGPTADPVEFGYYSSRPNIGTSILDGIKEKTLATCEVVYELGCHITKAGKIIETEIESGLSNPELYTLEEEEELIQSAVAAVEKSDIAIVCLGGSPNSSREAVTLEKHYGDNATLDLVGQQNELLKRVLKTGKPVVVILINGKPLSCGYVYENAPAVLEGWYLGEETGHALADILFGDKNPGGRLPVTIVRNSGFLPGYYSQKSTAFLKSYLFEKEEPYFWFGYGLSYTRFEYSHLTINKEKMHEGETVLVSVDIKNVGDRTGDEVVQMYISDPVASITRPERELKGFERISLEPGETRTVTFEINKEMLEFMGIDNQVKAEPGEFIVHVGKNCRETEEVTFVLEV